jgi:GT2 family glycosyltransferase
MPFNMDLTICIVNWNTANLLDKCLSSIYSSVTRYQYEIYVVDNNSNDDSLQIVRRYKKVKLMQNKENCGMAASLNQIISKSSKSKSKYLLFLHPDTEIGKDTIETMLYFMEKNPDIAVTGPRLVYPNDKIFLSCHKFPTISALLMESLNLNGVYMKRADHTKIQKVDIIASACLFMRRKIMEDIGLFDERFTNWMAEWDLCYRIKHKKAGKIVYAPISRVIHYEGMSDTTLKYKKYSFYIANLMLANLILFYKKHYSQIELFLLKVFSDLNLSLKLVRWFYSKERREGYLKGIRILFQ